MPLNGYKSVTVSEEAYVQARELAKLGIEESIGKAFANAINEYMIKRRGMINELTSVKDKWSQKI